MQPLHYRGTTEASPYQISKIYEQMNMKIS